MSTLAVIAAGALVLGALELFPPIGNSPAPASTIANQPDSAAANTVRQRVDTLHAGETLSSLLDRAGLSTVQATALLQAASALDMRRLPVGMPVVYRTALADSLPSEVIFQLAIDHKLQVVRDGESWKSEEIRIPWHTDTIVVEGTIRSNLYDAVAESNAELPERARAELAWGLADIYEYRVDMSRDLQVGDDFRVLAERSTGPGGAVRIGDILAARFTLSGTATEAVRFAATGGKAHYYDGEGRALHSGFLRAPLEFRRISSVFGRRKHPILGTWRSHKGTDYAANSGTPVRAIGDGTVIFAGRKGGYGNAVDIRHPNGFVTRYGHLRGFAKGIHAGKHVSIGQTIAYVGMTGLATGPHLHFEVLINGVQHDPRKALASKVAEPLPASQRAAFDSVRTQLVAELDAGMSMQQLASR
ncbi:MAG TPA: M23 family metallopeptidase [Burkholderiales bacterium]|nr:M23 family metallopeptidase [Burkholderiales bacterium]